MALLYVIEHFKSICRKLDWDTGPEQFDNFDDVVANTAEEKWTNITAMIPQATRVPACFDQALNSLIAKYVDDSARNDIHRYCRPSGSRIQRRQESMPNAWRHSSVMQISCLKATPRLTEQQKKDILFETYPIKWKQNYVRAGKNVRTDTMAQIVTYMENEKSFAAKEHEAGKKRKSTESKKQGGKTLGSKKQKGRPQPNDPCPLHPLNNHKWGKCFDNPDGKNYRPRNQRGGWRSQQSGRGGRGDGQERWGGNNGGRGNGGGRGGWNQGNRSGGNNQGGNGSGHNYQYQQNATASEGSGEAALAGHAPQQGGWGKSHHLDAVGSQNQGGTFQGWGSRRSDSQGWGQYRSQGWGQGGSSGGWHRPNRS